MRGAGQRLGVGHAVPDLQRALEQPGGLAVGVDARGGLRRVDAGAQRGRLVARRAVVVRDAGADPRAVAARLDAALERAGEREVQLGVLARQQVVVDDLAQQRVAEAVQAVLAGDDQVAGGGLAQRDAQVGRVELAGVGEQRVVGPLGDREQPQDLLGGLGQALRAEHQRVAQRRRQRGAAVRARGDQLLGEQRVALRAAVQPVDQPGIGRLVEDVRQLGGELGAGERREVDAAVAGVALDLGQQRAQRMAAVHLVGAVGDDRQHALRRHRAGEEGEERPRRAVRPVDVLEQQQDGLLAAETVEEREQRLEQAALGGAGDLVRAAHAARDVDLRQQRGQLDVRGVRQVVDRRVVIARERPQRGDERRVGQLALPQLDALAPEHARAGLAGAVAQLGHEPGLADAGLAGHERERRAAVGGLGERRFELRELGRPADQARAGDTRGQAPDYRARAGRFP